MAIIHRSYLQCVLGLLLSTCLLSTDAHDERECDLYKQYVYDFPDAWIENETEVFDFDDIWSRLDETQLNTYLADMERENETLHASYTEGETDLDCAAETMDAAMFYLKTKALVEYGAGNKDRAIGFLADGMRVLAEGLGCLVEAALQVIIDLWNNILILLQIVCGNWPFYTTCDGWCPSHETTKGAKPKADPPCRTVKYCECCRATSSRIQSFWIIMWDGWKLVIREVCFLELLTCDCIKPGKCIDHPTILPK